VGVVGAVFGAVVGERRLRRGATDEVGEDRPVGQAGEPGAGGGRGLRRGRQRGGQRRRGQGAEFRVELVDRGVVAAPHFAAGRRAGVGTTGAVVQLELLA